MSRTLRSWIIAIVIIIILLIPIYVDYYKNSHIETIKSYSSYSELVNKNSFAVIYVGKDVDGFDKWVVEGKGEGFAMKGSFYNEQDFNDFVETNTEV